jgi:hypothetical protein
MRTRGFPRVRRIEFPRKRGVISRRDIAHIVCAFATTLPRADIDRAYADRGTLDEAGTRVADNRADRWMLEMRDEEFAFYVRERADAIASPLSDDLNRASDTLAPRIGVRRKCEHAASRRQRFENGVGIALLLRIGTANWMHQENKVWCTDFSMLMMRDRSNLSDAINRWRADEMNTRGILAKTRNPCGTLAACWKVHVRELRDGMSHGFVSNTFCTISAMNVRDANSANRSSACSGKRFDAVPKYDHNIRREPLKECSECTDSATKRCSVGDTTRLTGTLHFESMHTMAA